MPFAAGTKHIEKLSAKSKKLHVLILDDSTSDARLIQRELQRQWKEIDITHITNPQAFTEYYEGRSWDIIFCDYDLCCTTGIDIYRSIPEQYKKEAPFILISGMLDQGIILRAIRAGIDDYLPKDQLHRLVPAVEKALLERQYKKREHQIMVRQSFLIELLELLNKNSNIQNIYQQIVDKVRESGDFDAVGIRLKENSMFPFRALSLRSEHSAKRLQKIDVKSYHLPEGKSCLLTEYLFQQRATAGKSASGNQSVSSFWINDNQDLKKIISSVSPQGNSSVDCMEKYYHSVAVLPVMQNDKLIGLLHLSSRKQGVFDEELVKFYEKISHIIGITSNRSSMQHNLAEHQEMIRRVIEHSTSVFFTRTPDKKFTFVGERIYDLLGYTPEEINKNWQSIISDSEINKNALSLAHRIMSSGKYQKPYEMELLHKDGSRKLVEVRETPIMDNGTLFQITGSITDISALKESERALLARDREYHNLVNKAKVGIAEDDMAGNITYLNHTFANLFGYSRKEMREMSFSSVIHPDDLNIFLYHNNRHHQGLGDNERYELRAIKKDKTVVYIELSVEIIKDREDKITGTRSYLWDITARKRNEILLKTVYHISRFAHEAANTIELFQEIRKLLSEVMDTTNIYIALYDEETDILRIPLSEDSTDKIELHPAGKTLSKYVIQQGRAMLLYEEEMDRLTRENVIDQVGKNSKVWLGAPLKHHGKTSGLIVVQSYDNRELYDQNDLKVLEFVSEEIASVLHQKQMEETLKSNMEKLKIMQTKLKEDVKRKVNELREKDAALALKSREAAIGAMISRLAHNWRQPLNKISTVIQALEDAWLYDQLSPQEVREKVELCVTEMEQLSKEIDSFRYFYKSSDKEEIFEINEIIAKVIKINANRFKNNNIILHTQQCEKSHVKGFVSEFQQVISSIITNSFDILLDRHIESPQVWLKTTCTNDQIIISIRDNGGGVDKNIEDSIFELYTSTKEELNNTGIGLYLCRNIIESHMKGKLKLINHEDGAEFVITLTASVE